MEKAGPDSGLRWGPSGEGLAVTKAKMVGVYKGLNLTGDLLLPPPPRYNLLPRIIEAKYLDAMDAEH